MFCRIESGDNFFRMFGQKFGQMITRVLRYSLGWVVHWGLITPTGRCYQWPTYAAIVFRRLATPCDVSFYRRPLQEPDRRSVFHIWSCISAFPGPPPLLRPLVFHTWACRVSSFPPSSSRPRNLHPPPLVFHTVSCTFSFPALPPLRPSAVFPSLLLLLPNRVSVVLVLSMVAVFPFVHPLGRLDQMFQLSFLLEFVFVVGLG